MKVKKLIWVLFLVAGCQLTLANATETDAFVKLKRAALWVPDLDRAVTFFRDVLGFKLDSISTPEVMDDPVVYDLYNADAQLAVRRALFSSSTEQRALFVMETKAAPTLQRGEPRYSGLVVQTGNLEAVIERAVENGFQLGAGNDDITPEGMAFKERVIVGPGGQATLVYELNMQVSKLGHEG